MSIGAWLTYRPKPKPGRYRRHHPKLFAQFGSWAHRTRKHRKGMYRP
jgi:hypothetical protein